MIRSFGDQDAAQLAAIHNRVYGQKAVSPESFRELVKGTLEGGGLAWVIGEPLLSGYAMVTPVPGLPGVGDLAGCIAPEQQRHGLGSELLQFVLEALQGGDFWQISYCVTNLASPAACFLRQHDFFVEHEEVLMSLAEFDRLPAAIMSEPVRLRSYSRPTAVPLFCEFYEKSFRGLPWDQPFSTAEVSATLTDANNMLFLTLDGEAIGFAWVDLDRDGKGLIEPLGIIPAYQGKGFGRMLLLRVLQELIRRGAKEVEIGAWRDNQVAIQLYESFGFRQQKLFTYLAFNLDETGR
jgi:ribosomal-protein-alanine N-acetyltransferase